MKLSGWVYLVVGISLSIIILSYGYFWHQQPNEAEAVAINANADEYKDQASKAVEAKAKDRVKKAQAAVDAEGVQWEAIVAVKTPPKDINNGGIDLGVNRYQLTLDAPRFRNSVQKAVNAQLRHGGVLVMQGPSVSMPPTEPEQIVESYFNWPAYPFPICVFKFGTVTVQGTYDQVMENVRGWADMPNYLAVTHDVQLTGTTPKLTATYDVTVVALIRGDKIAQNISSNIPGTSGAAGGGARGGGGRPGGQPGGGSGGGGGLPPSGGGPRGG